MAEAKRGPLIRLHSQRSQGGNHTAEVCGRHCPWQRCDTRQELSWPSDRRLHFYLYRSTLPPNICTQRQSTRQAIPTRWLPGAELEESQACGPSRRCEHLPDSRAQSGLQPDREPLPLRVENVEGAGAAESDHERIKARLSSSCQEDSAHVSSGAHRPHHRLDGQAHGTYHQLKGSAYSILIHYHFVHCDVANTNFPKIECTFWLR